MSTTPDELYNLIHGNPPPQDQLQGVPSAPKPPGPVSQPKPPPPDPAMEALRKWTPPTPAAPQGLTPEISKMIADSAAKHGVDPIDIQAIMRQESNFNPNAISSAGAIGPMQVMPATFAEMGGKNIYDTAENIDVGTAYYKKMLDQFKDPTLARAAYNAGPGNVIKAGYQVPNIPETQNYVQRTGMFADQFRGITPEDQLRNWKPPTALRQLNLTNFPEAQPPEEKPGLLKSGFMRGLGQTGEDFLSVGALAAAKAGNEELTKSLLDTRDQVDEWAKQYPPLFKSYADVHGLGDAVKYAAENIAQQVPLLATLIIPGATAGTISARIAARGLAGTAAKEAASIAAKRWGTSAAAAVDFGLLTGETAGGMMEAGGKPGENAGRAVATGALKTLLDFAPFAAVANSMGLIKIFENSAIQRIAERGFWPRAGVNAATILATEVPTEVAQEALDIAAEKTVQTAQQQGWNEQDIQRLKETAVATSTMAALGLPAAALHKPTSTVDSRPESDLNTVVNPPTTATTASAPESNTSASQMGFNLDMPPGRALYNADTVNGEPVDAYTAEIAGPPKPEPLPGEEEVTPQVPDSQLQLNLESMRPTPVDWGKGEKIANRIQLLRDGEVRPLTQGEIDQAEALKIEALVPPGQRTPAQQHIVFQARKWRLDQLRASIPSTVPGEFVGPLTSEGLISPIRVPEAKGGGTRARLQQLILQLRATPGNYTKGSILKVAVQKKIDRIQAQIDALAPKAPTQAPVAPPTAPVRRGRRYTYTPQPAQAAAFEDVAPQEQPAQPAAPEAKAREAVQEPVPNIANLNDAETMTLVALDQKEKVEGLSEAEYATVERLLSKAAGEVAPQKYQPAEEVKQYLRSLMRKKKEGGKRGATREQVEKWIAPLRKKYGIDITVTTIEDLPIGTIQHLGGLENIISSQGMYTEYGDGTREAFIFLENVEGKRDAQMTYLHEVVGHLGIRAILSDADIRALQEIIGDANWIDTQERMAWIAEHPNMFADLWAKIRLILIRALRRLGVDISSREASIDRLLRGIARRSERQLRGRVIGKYSPPKATIETLYQNPTGGGTIASAQNLEQFLSEHSRLTARIFQSINPKNKATADRVRQVLKEVKANKQEMDVAEQVLAELLAQSVREKKPWTWFDFVQRYESLLVPLGKEYTEQFADHGLERIESAQFRDGEITTLYTGPWIVPGILNGHFSDITNAYAGHVRTFDKGESRHVVEVQSDLLQRMAKVLRIPEHIQNIKKAGYDVQYLSGGFHVFAPGVVFDRNNDATWVTDEFGRKSIPSITEKEAPAEIQKDVRALYKLDDFGIYVPWNGLVKQIQMARAIKTSASFEQLQKNLVVRMIREQMKDAAQEGFTSLKVADAATVAHVEGWVRTVNENVDDVDLAKMERQLLRLQLLKPKLEKGIVKGQMMEMWGLASNRVMNWETGEDTIKYTLQSTTIPITRGNINEKIMMYEEQIARVNAIQKDQAQPIEERLAPGTATLYNWYKTEFPDMLQKKFGATHVMDSGDGYWKIPLTWEMGEKPVTALFRKTDVKGAPKMNRELDKFTALWEIKLGDKLYTPLQMAQRFGYLAPEIKQYINEVEASWNTKSNMLFGANEVIRAEWNKLSAVQSKRLGEALFYADQLSTDEGRQLTPEEEMRLLDQLELSDEAKQVYGSVKKQLAHVLDRAEQGLKYNTIRETLDDPSQAKQFLDEWNAATPAERVDLSIKYKVTGELLEGSTLINRLNELEDDFAKMRNMNYFPRMRFGKKALTVRAKKDLTYDGEEFKAGQVVRFETYESETAQKDRAVEMFKEFNEGDFDVKASTLTDQEFSFLSVPPALQDAIAKQLELSPDERQRLKEIFIKSSPGRAFLKHMVKRRGVAGFSEDAKRVFATYMINAANHIARIEHYKDMQSALYAVDQRSKGIDPVATAAAQQLDPKAGNVMLPQVDVNKIGMLNQYFKDHYKYLMNPGNDFAKMRALGFQWYLGFNAKSAVVNLSQVPLVTYPYLGARYGDVRAFRSITRAMGTAAKFLTGKTKHGLSLQELEVIDRLEKAGLLDESLATELAGFSESHVLERVVPRTTIAKWYNKFNYAGAWMFRHAEKYNRYVTAIASAKLALENSNSDIDHAYTAAKEAIQGSQFEYAKWARPRYSRGKLSAIFMFQNYTQQAAYLAFGGHGAGTAIRFWLMMTMAAGMMGWPLAEDLIDLIDWGSTELKKAMGSEDPYTDIRTDLKKFLNSVVGDENSDFVMHGFSRYYGLGPAHVLELMGIPIPNTDVSGSIGLGRAVPGLQPALEVGNSPEEKFGRTMIDIMGPVAAMPYMLWRSLSDNNPDTWKKWERAMPTAIKSTSKFFRWSERGAETYQGGGVQTAFDPEDIDQRVEVIAQGFGFTPTRVNQQYELSSRERAAQKWYSTQRQLLLEDYAYAQMNNNSEMRADVMKAIRMYNHSVPDPNLTINASTLKKSYVQRAKRAQLRTLGIPPSKMYRGLYRELEDVYPHE